MNYFLKHKAAFKMFVDHFYQRGLVCFLSLTETSCGRALQSSAGSVLENPQKLVLPALLGLELLGSGDAGS